MSALPRCGTGTARSWGGWIVPRRPAEAPGAGFGRAVRGGRRPGLAQPGHAARPGHPAPGGPLGCAGADPRSERRGQGARRSSHPPLEPAQCACVPQAQRRSRKRRSRRRGTARSPGQARLGTSAWVDEIGAGTLFLDEIADLSPTAQARLLDVLEREAFQRQRGSQQTGVQMRVIASTRHDIERFVREDRFREDLYTVWESSASTYLPWPSASRTFHCWSRVLWSGSAGGATEA